MNLTFASLKQIGSSTFAGCSSPMILPENDVGLVKVGTILPSNVLLDLLTKHVTLPSDHMQPGPAHRFEKNGKVCQAFFRKQWLEEYHWLVYGHPRKMEDIVFFLRNCPVVYNSHGGGIFGKLITTNHSNILSEPKVKMVF